MSLLLLLAIVVSLEIFFIIMLFREDRTDWRIREYEKALRIMSAYLGHPCENLPRDLSELIKNKKEV